MTLSANDQLLIVATAAGCTAAITLVALLVLRRCRARTISFQFMVLVVSAIASLVCSTIAISAQMYLSAHDLEVLLWVVGISALMSLDATLLTARAAGRSFADLRESVVRVGRGDVVDARAHDGKEFADISEQLATTSARLAEARAEVERLDASRRQFFAWISHDLRTPLTGLSALAEALDDDVVTDRADYIRQIRGQVGTMNHLVDDLFDLSRIQSGALELRTEHVELLDVVSDAVADVQHLAAARDVDVAHSGVAGRMLQGDPHQLTRVMVNLLTNSIRHAPQGSQVLVSADQRADRLVLSVLDEGSGVDCADLTRMFEVGWRAGTARTPESRPGGSPGAGLGLAIVHGIVRAHGGEVRAEHTLAGFRVRVDLPEDPRAVPDRSSLSAPY